MVQNDFYLPCTNILQAFKNAVKLESINALISILQLIFIFVVLNFVKIASS